VNRRRLLAALGTGLSASIAGCGYAHAGGEPRLERSLGSRQFVGFDATTWYLRTGDRLIRAVSGTDRPFNRPELTTVDAFTYRGYNRWSYEHESAVDAVAVASDATRLYLLETADGDAVGGTLSAVRSPEGSERTGGTIRWQVDLEATSTGTEEGGSDRTEAEESTATDEEGSSEDESSPMNGLFVADSERAYVVFGSTLVSVAEPTDRWRRPLPKAVSALAVADGVVAAIDGGVVAFAPDGTERWRVDTKGAPSVASTAEHVFVHDNAGITRFDAVDGTEHWHASIGPDRHPPTLSPGGLVAYTNRRVHCFDPADGSVRWQVTASSVETPVVADEEAAYSVRHGCVVTAATANGARWITNLEARSCSVVDGWLDEDTVAFLFESGDIRRFQRMTRRPRGML